ncbi:Gfo/Idh/MocA family protein [Nesterenkonia ebinurensis]|uniref:Gfo/Idh/MocA family protein n=1 Tax=Nesterenkonia ebinurensis TaxID=2608252 RepID=UPI00123E1A25|nr:Gfo/Idh/MocA family oxidoreductase [Nesterenkonia ebinurensis]
MIDLETAQPLGIIVNGATGRMGYRQHLVRSLLAIRDSGGVPLPDGSRRPIELYLVGRSPEKLKEVAETHGIDRWTTDLDEALNADGFAVYFDALITQLRVPAIRKAIAAGKHIYTEKPTAESYTEALALAEEAEAAGIHNGVVHDKLYLPGLLKLRRLIDSGFFGEILSVRGEFGYWVFEGDWQPAQRPSWNYRTEDGGGIVVDMFPHWNYVIENLFGSISTVYTTTRTHIPTRVDEAGQTYTATADDAAYGIFELENGPIVQLNSSWTTRVNRDELVEFHVDGTMGSAVVGLFSAKIQERNATPKPVWNPDIPDPLDYSATWSPIPQNEPAENGFKLQWIEFLRSVLGVGEHRYDFRSGAAGMLLAEAALASQEQGRKVSIAEHAKSLTRSPR